MQDLTDASGRNAASNLLDTLLQRTDWAASESQWDQALVALASRVFYTPSELHAWLTTALDTLSAQCTAGEALRDGQLPDCSPYIPHEHMPS